MKLRSSRMGGPLLKARAMPQWREACTRVMWDAELLSIPLAVRGILSWRPVLGGTPMRQIFLLSAIVFISAAGFEFGIARFESSQGVAQLVGSSGKHSQTAKMYTNADVDQLNQANGTVQYGGKTERLD